MTEASVQDRAFEDSVREAEALRSPYEQWKAGEGLPTIRGMEWECRRGYPEVVRFRSVTAFQKGWPLTAGHRVRHVAFTGLRGSKLAQEPDAFDEVGAQAIAG